MSLLIVTPCYGGQCTTQYLQSCLDLRAALTISNIEHDWLITTNESLVQRARNTSVATFLKTHYERMIFIDADIEFSANDVAKLWNLDADVAVGAYSMKKEGAKVSAWVNKEQIRLVDLSELNEPTPVDYAGTSFMMM